MYRTNRETGTWFVDDFKPMIADRQHAASMGPGKYESPDRPDAYSKRISWNSGKVPFATGDGRFKTNYRTHFQPGPGAYDPVALAHGSAPGMQTYN